MTDLELLEIKGGAISGNLLNYLSKLITTILDIGRTIGSAISYMKKGKTC